MIKSIRKIITLKIIKCKTELIAGKTDYKKRKKVR